MLISRYLHKKRSEVSIKTRSTQASLSFKGQATKHTTVKWPIQIKPNFFFRCERGKPEYLRKLSQSGAENQQTQPMYGVGDGIEPWPRLVEGE